MKPVYKAFKDDLDVATLYADALMNMTVIINGRVKSHFIEQDTENKAHPTTDSAW
jgi:phage protein D